MTEEAIVGLGNFEDASWSQDAPCFREKIDPSIFGDGMNHEANVDKVKAGIRKGERFEEVGHYPADTMLEVRIGEVMHRWLDGYNVKTNKLGRFPLTSHVETPHTSTATEIEHTTGTRVLRKLAKRIAMKNGVDVEMGRHLGFH